MSAAAAAEVMTTGNAVIVDTDTNITFIAEKINQEHRLARQVPRQPFSTPSGAVNCSSSRRRR